eukprot:7587174-Ditylum_brightwellii.AAC.1
MKYECDSWVQRLQSPMSSNTTVTYLSPCKQPTLPEYGSVKGEVSIIKEEELGQNADNISAAARQTNASPIQDTFGPEQDSASGVNDPDED